MKSHQNSRHNFQVCLKQAHHVLIMSPHHLNCFSQNSQSLHLQRLRSQHNKLEIYYQFEVQHNFLEIKKSKIYFIERIFSLILTFKLKKKKRKQIQKLTVLNLALVSKFQTVTIHLNILYCFGISKNPWSLLHTK